MSREPVHMGWTLAGPELAERRRSSHREEAELWQRGGGAPTERRRSSHREEAELWQRGGRAPTERRRSYGKEEAELSPWTSRLTEMLTEPATFTAVQT